ncbi:hypothetical protein LCGC14_2309910 [marine sediment metagenome]|uniref:Uncharacterized protein n=1 Tax=marine sediment metagenome TaxID=412755 RepID=A0A0F9CLG2_9ZZZZ
MDHMVWLQTELLMLVGRMENHQFHHAGTSSWDRVVYAQLVSMHDLVSYQIEIEDRLQGSTDEPAEMPAKR